MFPTCWFLAKQVAPLRPAGNVPGGLQFDLPLHLQSDAVGSAWEANPIKIVTRRQKTLIFKMLMNEWHHVDE